MTHISENSKKLLRLEKKVACLSELALPSEAVDQVYLLRFPAQSDDNRTPLSPKTFRYIANFCSMLGKQSTVCILATPYDAAQLCALLQTVLKFQFWIAVKAASSLISPQATKLPEHHLALLVFTRYKGPLRHVPTRISYSYCLACGKTTKDYGGKKHLYHKDGTLMSDVWRDIGVDPRNNIDPVINRLCDVFGLPPYTTLTTFDFTSCEDLTRVKSQHSHSLLLTPHPSRLRSRLINDDCLRALKRIPDNSIDFCFADLPYNLDKKYDGYHDSLEVKQYIEWCNKWFAELARILKPGRTCAVLNIPHWAIRHFQFLITVLQFQYWIVWDALSFPVRKIMPAHYATLCFSKGEPCPLPGMVSTNQSLIEKSFLSPRAETYCLRPACVRGREERAMNDRDVLSDLWTDIHRLKHNSQRANHPCQLPPHLMRRLFALFTQPGEIILDCFNGVGTSTLVAQQMERRYIGIERSQKYHDAADRRHKAVSKGKDPFSKKNGVPKTKNNGTPRIQRLPNGITKKALQLDVRRIAQRLGRLPTREEVISLSRYPIKYFDEHFVSWGEVCRAARTTGISEYPKDNTLAQ